jgi:hypothetical protein
VLKEVGKVLDLAFQEDLDYHLGEQRCWSHEILYRNISRKFEVSDCSNFKIQVIFLA